MIQRLILQRQKQPGNLRPGQGIIRGEGVGAHAVDDAGAHHDVDCLFVGRTDLIRPRQNRITHRADTIDLSNILSDLPAVHYAEEDKYNFELEKTLDISVLLPGFAPYFQKKKPHTQTVQVSSVNRTFGTILGSEITRRFGETLAEDTYRINAQGGGGQSFGAFIPKGLTICLTGDANDYFGKGLSGGKLIVKPEENAGFAAKDNIIIGNVALYGATGGKAFVGGIAGERFCVRNSGAIAVAEGCGDHGCEYMTGGRAAILTFHSGEDRLVKQAFKDGLREGIYSDAARDVIRPSAEECARNPRARSTKLRWAVRA